MVNIVPPRAKIVPLDWVLTRRSGCVVLRPAWRNPGQRAAFVEAMQGFEDVPYDLRRILAGISLGTLYAWLAVTVRMKRPTGEISCWICAKAIIESLRRVKPEFAAVRELALDYYRLGFSTTNDFLRIVRLRPDLLAVLE